MVLPAAPSTFGVAHTTACDESMAQSSYGRNQRSPFCLVNVARRERGGFLLCVCLLFNRYYPFSAANGMVSSFSLSVTMVADLLHQCHRATVIGYLSACFSIGILIGPILGGYISTYSAGRRTA